MPTSPWLNSLGKDFHKNLVHVNDHFSLFGQKEYLRGQTAVPGHKVFPIDVQFNFKGVQKARSLEAAGVHQHLTHQTGSYWMPFTHKGLNKSTHSDLTN